MTAIGTVGKTSQDTLRDVLTRLEKEGEVVPYRILRPVVDSVEQVVGSRLRLFHGEPVNTGTVGSVA